MPYKTFLSGSIEFINREFTDTSLIENTLYSYVVRAVNGAGLTVDSASKEITTNTCSSGGPKSDLIISIAPTINSGVAKEGFNLTFKATVKNQGTVSTGASFTNVFFIDLNADGSLDVTLTPNPSSSDLSANDTTQIISGTWNAIRGTHRVVACADFPLPGVINEGTNESNNCSNASGGVTQGTGAIVIGQGQEF